MIQRQFVRIGNRHVHYRHAGSGPVLILLHQSPQNSRMWLSMIERFAGCYTVIAPDTPGFGYSDPLPGKQDIDGFARATLAFADALGIDRFALFGMHTGGLIGMHLGWIAPERLSALVIDGYALFNDAERARYTDKYLPPFVPSWDGGHLRWLWSRMREQLYFFPWCDPSADCAIVLPPYTPAGTHDAAMDILDVGDNYRIGYGAAFAYTQRQRVAELRCPAWLVYRTTDVLLPHHERLPALPENVRCVTEHEDVDGLHRRMDAILAQTTDVLGACTATLAARQVEGWQRRILATVVGEIAVWLCPGEGGAVLQVHAPGQHPLQPDQVAADARTTVLVELPGHGASSEVSAVPDAATMQAALQAICTQLLAGKPLEIHAHEGACSYVPALVAALGTQVSGVVLHRPWLLDAAECQTFLQQLPDPQVHRAGGHMAEAWQWERERHLLWPWLAPSMEARRRVAGPPTAQVHANVVELLRLGRQLHALFADVAVPGLAEAVAALPVPVRLVYTEQDDYRQRMAALAQRLAG